MGESRHCHRHSDEIRRSWQNQEEILANVGLKSGMIFVDIGCGYGFFSIPAAKVVGPGGKVICIDIDRESIRMLRNLAEAEGLENVETIVGRAEETIPCEGCADIVFFGIVLHDFQDPYKVLDNARRMLKPSGILVNLDWKKEEMDIGPPVSIRFDEKTASDMISSQGFEVLNISRSGKYHYIITAMKN